VGGYAGLGQGGVTKISEVGLFLKGGGDQESSQLGGGGDVERQERSWGERLR